MEQFVDDQQPASEQPAVRAIRHAPLRRWSPGTAEERSAARGFLVSLLAFPYVTVGTIAFLGWVYAVQLFLGWPMAWLFPNSVDLVDQLFILRLGECLGWLSPTAVLEDGEYWRLISATLLHASNLHVIGNCWMLYLFGRNVENGIGRSAFIVTYVGAGVVGALFSVALLGQESLGASGAVLGMLGATLAFGRRYRQQIPKPLRDYFGLDLWVIVGLIGLLSLLPMVDWAGHLGGFLWGLGVGALWPAQLYSEGRDDLGHPLRVALAALCLVAVVATLGVMAQRSLEVQGFLPDSELRALRYAVDEGQVDTQLEIAARLAESYPDHVGVQLIHASVLVSAGRWGEAADKLKAVENDWPGAARDEPYFDNDVAWSLFMGHPDDPEAVAEGLARVRRNLAQDRSNHAMQNTLAYGLYLDRQYRQADQALSEAMAAVKPEDRGSDVYLDVLIQLALKEPQEALRRYQAAMGLHPEGEFRGAAEEKLVEVGMLTIGEVP